ncbi:helix-turn-helix domain-containing protein [Auritidibacter ignavus]|uniref:helix-turn-helix domain-containing protein n=1 Tax=Auritidibacter ignavus TaxID=678932 RepID=UPI00141B5DDA|nr:PucR family transcriptional regulator [Auritidibacter ignavus]NIH72590.1 hypothetical protein [Auritidibacter ignavus]WGH83464.1 helix-turn-helix domain-containing protein [Auritidibacter ignavus]
MTNENLLSTPIPSDTQRWNNLLEQLNVDRLTKAFLDKLRTVPEYQEGRLSNTEIAKTAKSTFYALIQHMQGQGNSANLDVKAFDLGVLRARVGIPSSAMMSAIRFDYTILWNAIISLAHADDALLLLRHANYVWQVVDVYAQKAREGHAAEKEQREHHTRLNQQALVTELLEGSGTNNKRTQEILTELNLPTEGELILMSASGHETSSLKKYAIDNAHLRDSAIPFNRGATFLLLIPGYLWHIRTGIPQLREQYRWAFLKITDTSELSKATALATELSKIPLSRPNVTRTIEDWVALVRARLQGSPLEHALDIDRDLSKATEVESYAVKETVETYLRTGSVQRVADSMYCHRNTVTNRLRKFYDLTGIDVTVPKNAARAVIAWL